MSQLHKCGLFSINNSNVLSGASWRGGGALDTEHFTRAVLNAGALNEMYSFHPESGAWTRLASTGDVPSARFGCGPCIIHTP